MLTFKLHNGAEWTVLASSIKEIWTHPKDDAVSVLTDAGHHKSVEGPIKDVRDRWAGATNRSL